MEIDKTDGFLFLFTRPIDAVLFSLSYHDMLRELSDETKIALQARAGIHVGEVVLRRNTPEDVARGAKPIEVDGLSKHAAARVMSVALGGQTLMTGATYQFAKRGAVGESRLPEDIQWVGHGDFKLKGIEDPVPLYEIGREGLSPLRPPPDGEKVRRVRGASDGSAGGSRTKLLFGALAGVLLASVLILSLKTLFPEPTPPPAPEHNSGSPQAGVDKDGDTSGSDNGADGESGEAGGEADEAGEDDVQEEQVVLEIISKPQGATIEAQGSTSTSRHKIYVPAKPDAIDVTVSMTGYQTLETSCHIQKTDIDQGTATCELTLTRKRRTVQTTNEGKDTEPEKSEGESDESTGLRQNPY